MSNLIYDQHDKAFQHVSAYVVMRGADRVATVAIKFSASGLRRTAYVRWTGAPMFRGVANGGGYDKSCAAVAAAARKMETAFYRLEKQDPCHLAFIRKAMLDDGKRWDDALRDAGFSVFQAV